MSNAETEHYLLSVHVHEKKKSKEFDKLQSKPIKPRYTAW
jgi:hypothetical protein